MITLNGFGPAFSLPDPSLFVTKVEVLLKMAGLEFRTAANGLRRAPKRKLPFDDGGTIVAAVGSTLVARAAPAMARADIEANVSAGARPAGFVINVPVGRDAGKIRIFALMADGTAAQLASQLADSTGGAFANATMPSQ